MAMPDLTRPPLPRTLQVEVTGSCNLKCRMCLVRYRPVLGRTWLWLCIGLLIGANIWTSRTMLGTTAGWQLWWAELAALVGLAAIAVANLYVQGGMKLRYVSWLALALGAYDVIFSSVYPLTDKLVQTLGAGRSRPRPELADGGSWPRVLAIYERVSLKGDLAC